MNTQTITTPTRVCTKIVSANEFWNAMCDADFRRLSFRAGQINDTYYICLDEPQRIPGFVPRNVAVVVTALRRWWSGK